MLADGGKADCSIVKDQLGYNNFSGEDFDDPLKKMALHMARADE